MFLLVIVVLFFHLLSSVCMENQLYLDLLKKALVGYQEVGKMEYKELKPKNRWLKAGYRQLSRLLPHSKSYVICSKREVKAQNREVGKDWPTHGDTMIGLARLSNIEACIKQILRDQVPGDFIETGVWKGGATIFMKALLVAHEISDRRVWVADSFAGLPPPDEQNFPADKGDQHATMEELAISVEEVKGNFKKYDLLDDQVHFLKGWFKDTLPTAPIDKLALLRLDGDMYSSTYTALTHLYPKLSPGGFVIIDDRGAVAACQQAVLDYRRENGITEKITDVDWTAVYWRKNS